MSGDKISLRCQPITESSAGGPLFLLSIMLSVGYIEFLGIEFASAVRRIPHYARKSGYAEMSLFPTAFVKEYT